MEYASEAEAAKGLHQRVVRETRSVLLRWVVVLSVNFLAHFMRMGVSLTYMTSELKASELEAGAVITAHLALIGLANAYLSFSMNSHSFETMITVRFVLLTLVTFGEWAAQTFAEFATVYIIASLSIVWVAISDGYFVQMLPASEAKDLSMIASITDRVAFAFGLALGGCLGGLLSLQSVFLGSFIVSLLSLLFILKFVLGKEKQIKEVQQSKIAQIYQDHPELFPDPSDRFPLTFIRKEQNTTDDNHGWSSMLRGLSDLFCSHSGLPMVFFLITVGVRTAQNLEILAWWNVYATQVMGKSIALSNAQLVLAYAVSTPIMAVYNRVMRVNHLSLDQLLRHSIIVIPVSAAMSIVFLALMFPSMSFEWFWLGFPVLFATNMIGDPYRLVLQVMESPPDQVGSVFALYVLSRSFIPAVQHVIIGALWNYGGPTHPWFFGWFAVLNGFSASMFICYWITKKRVIANQQQQSKHSTAVEMGGLHYELMSDPG